MVYTTGLGAVTPPVADGSITGNSPSRQVGAVQATVDGEPAQVLYAGAAPGAGVGPVNGMIPQTGRFRNLSIAIVEGNSAGFVPGSKAAVAVR